MGKAFMNIDAAFLRQLLHLPHDCDVVTSVEGERGIVRVMVEHGSISAETVEVSANFKKQEAIVFDGFLAVRRRSAPSADTPID